MTDNEIIKALECCVCNLYKCPECPYNNETVSKCSVKLKFDALDLINRQQKDIDDLCKVLGRAYQENCFLEASRKSVRTEAVKEFAERLYERARPTVEFCEVVLGADIDNLVKEMVGESYV